MLEQLGPLVRRMRTDARLTQEKLAELSAVSVSTIRRVETGRAADLRLSTLNQLAEALNASPEDTRRLAAALAGVAWEPEGRPAPGTPAPAPASGPPAPQLRPELAGPAAELAREVRRRLRREEEQRRVHDPFVLPVRWELAPPELSDLPENVLLVPPGGAVPELDLAGEVGRVAEVYRRVSSGRLVVLGPAGSGKSVLAIRLALDLLEAGPECPERVPVIFSLGSWDPTVLSLRDWLTDLLLRDHPRLAARAANGATLAAELVHSEAVLPVLDGFDEIAEGLRTTVLAKLNETRLPLVLTSRAEQFTEAAGPGRAPLLLAAAIELSELTVADLAHYLPRTARGTARPGGADPVWQDVLARLDAASAEAAEAAESAEHAEPGGPAARLADVLRTPLMVILARTMYSESADRDPIELLDPDRFPTRHALEEHLLAGFVPTLYRDRVPDRAPDGRRGPARRWGAERAQRWLGHLAQHLVGQEHDQRDLAWWRLAASLRRSTRVLAVAVTCAVAISCSDWLVGLVASPDGIGQVLLDGALIGPVVGVAFAAMYAVLITFQGGLVRPTQVRLGRPRLRGRAARSSLRAIGARFWAVLLGGFVMGAGVAAATTLERWLFDGLPITDPRVLEGTAVNVLGFGLILGSATGLAVAVVTALESPLDTNAAASPAGLLAANRSTVRRQLLCLVPTLTLSICFGGFPVADLLQPVFGPMTWDLPDGLMLGAIGGLGGSLAYVLAFTAWGQWVVFCRIWLPVTGRLPRDPAAFLDDAYQRGVLRQTGAVHQFRHLRLQHHLARTHRESRSRYVPVTFGAPEQG
ncbi:helix-turn-helix domain-containing protein [Kitasatospora viridis]|uniref:NACHT domain-containing protein n=1 Tax=Kitasatospora viridis TaxID=281105 RepID=A0A561UMY7_9ACTN|nr:helix-turn-helix domain-containing protein [Kitasatospora viridis]TWG00735.1 NACHT domain-containing protein [Kitasatospora viridis]